MLALLSAQPRPETGEINGAQFRIDMPANWNGVLIVYCHGYAPAPGTFDATRPNAASAIASLGYAVAQSGYAGGGFAVEEAMLDTESLRRYFRKKYGAPKETYVMGHSMGGHLTRALVEAYPTGYDGGLALCGALGSSYRFLKGYFFDGRVVFDYFFPGVLPSPAAIPPGWKSDDALVAGMVKQMTDAPEKAAQVRAFLGVKTGRDAAGVLVFMTAVLQELQQRAGGNAFDNRNTIYEIPGDRNALNDGVTRYAGDPKAALYVQRFTEPSGALKRPLLALHTTYDPVVPPWIANEYSVIANTAGSGALFVQQYVKRDGHCTMSAAETLSALSDLREWATKGTRPAPGLRK